MFFLSPMDIILLLPALILTLYAQAKVKRAFSQMSKVKSVSGLTGAGVARSLLQRNGINDVEVEEVAGNLTDHYDPINKKLRLSSPVYSSNSLAAIGVAAHETGHAIQHKLAYAPLKIRQSIFPVANLGSSLGIPMFIAGLFLGIEPLQTIGIFCIRWCCFFSSGDLAS